MHIGHLLQSVGLLLYKQVFSIEHPIEHTHGYFMQKESIKYGGDNQDLIIA